MADHIRLNQMVFYGYHGVLPEERALGQRFVVDVEIRADLQPAGQSDNLERTLNYVDLYQTVKGILTGPSVLLIETLAERVAECVLKDFALAESVAVRVRKPSPPMGGAMLASSEVWIERSRHLV